MELEWGAGFRGGKYIHCLYVALYVAVLEAACGGLITLVCLCSLTCFSKGADYIMSSILMLY